MIASCCPNPAAADGRRSRPSIHPAFGDLLGYYPGEKLYRMVYCEDPFGNLIEIYSHSYELTYSARAYQE